MRATTLILRTRWKIANNYVAGIRRHLWFHLAVFLGVILFLMVGGSATFHLLFDFLNRQEDFGALMMNRLVGMLMMTFFSMLMFSNIIITLSTTYISQEINFHMSQPVPHRSIFLVKLVESIVYSSWAFVILSLPFFISFGLVREVSPWFYPLIFLLVIPFLVIPAGIGAILTMVMSALLPARRALKWAVALAAFAILAIVILVRLSGIGSRFFLGEVESFTQILSFLQAGKVVWAPHHWFTQSMLALSKGEWKQAAYWAAMIVSTALMILQVSFWLAPYLYYRGWCMATDSGAPRRKEGNLGGRIFDWCESLLRPFSRTTRALVMKDLKTFWRDPAQWSQLIILFGLLFVYMANLRGAHYRRASIEAILPFWQAILSLFNLAATCCVLSILTTRFVYPMLSLEGKQFWVVGLAPLRRSRVVWQKYWLCWIGSFLLTATLVLFSNWILDVSRGMFLLSLFTVFCISWGLTSLSVGLGASTPNFKEDNPARIANGVGGTLNVILSLVYIAAVVAFEAIPAFLLGTGRIQHLREAPEILIGCALGLIFVHAVTIVVPMRIGLSRWNRIEF